MKNITIILFLLVTSLGFAQTIVEDFDPERPTNAFFNDGDQVLSTILQIDDPTGASRGKVLNLITNAADAPWQGAGLILQTGNFLDLRDDPGDSDEKKVKVWIYSDTSLDILAKVTSGGAPAAIDATHSGQGWEQLTFDFAFRTDNAGPANGIYQRITFFPAWYNRGGTCTTGCYPPFNQPSGNPNSTPLSNILIDEISFGPDVIASCTAVLGSITSTCDTFGVGTTDDTYTATIPFSGANNGNDFVVTASAGTVGGDNPTSVASGTITVTEIPEGTDLTVTINDTVTGGVCALSTVIFSPECVPTCSTSLGSITAICDTFEAGETDDTYTATIFFSGANTGNNFVVTASAGNVGGDNPTSVASGTITVTEIPEGTDLTVTVNDTVAGGVCALSTVIVSPGCLPPPLTGDVYINDGTFAAGDFSTAAGQDIATNDGSAAEPFATLDYALARSTKVPGDIIYIDAGTYSWASTHALTDSGTIANPITIQGKGNNETNITTTAASSTSAGLHFTTGSHWVVKDLNWTATAARAVWVAGVRGITLDNCSFAQTSTSGSHQGIIIGSASGQLTVKNCTLTRSNTVTHIIEIVPGASLTVLDNVFTFPNLVASAASSIFIKGNATSEFIMERNRLFGGGYGVGFIDTFTYAASANTVIKNNFFSTTWGIVSTGITGLKVYNNSFYTNRESIYGVGNSFLTNWDIQNNILYTASTSRTCILSGSTTSHPAVMDNNHYYSPNTGAARQGPNVNGPILSFTAWQGAAGGPWETNGQGGNAASFNPLYVDAANGDLHLLPGSPAIGAGVDVGITDDIDGDARPLSGAFDMGADEFTATVSSDASLSDLQVNDVSISGFSPVTTNYNVVVSCSVSSIPQITSATPTSPLASVVITQAPDVFEDATVVVTAEDGITTETYTVTIGVDSSDIIQDFEPPAAYTGLTGDNGTTATLVPSPGGITGNSLRLVSTSVGEIFQAGFFNQVSDFVVLTPENNTVQVDVYSTQAFNLRLKLESGATPIERTVQYTTPNTWQTLTFNFGAVTATYSRIVFFLNSNATNDGFLTSQNFTAFVDNISLSSVQTERLTYTYDNGWLPSDPIGISGCFDTINIVSGNISISADTEIDNLIVAPGVSLTVDTGVTLTTSTVNLNSTSQQFSSLILEGTLTGTVHYNRFASVIGTNDLIASPLSGQEFGAFATANPNLAASGTLRAFAPYNTSAGAYQNYDAIVNASTVISSGVGFRVATLDGSPLTFTGTVLTSNPSISISDAAAGNAWNLIGNPYPSYLDFSTFFAGNQEEFDTASAFQAIYGYDGDASNGWTVWNQATITDTTITELIAPGQAFFVKAKTGGGLVNFTTAMQRTGTSDDFIVGRSTNNTNVASSKIILTTEGKNANTRVYFIEGQTRGLDSGYDAGSFQGGAGSFSIFTNLVENNTGLDMVIQTLGYDDLNDVVVPLGVNALAGSTLTIGLEANSSLPSHINLYLDDTLENTLTVLNTSDYTFSLSNDLVGTGRFFLRYASKNLSLNTNEELNELIIYNDATNKDITVKGVLTAATKTDLYDIQGRLVLSENLNQSLLTNTIDGSALHTGIYVIKVSNKNSTKTQKLIIK
jgi:hypothetical protein